MENTKRNGNTRPSYQSPEKPVCASRSNSYNTVWNNWLVHDWERSTTGCLLSPCLFNLYTEHITWNARVDELQAGIKIGGRSINNLRYADDSTLMAESEEELKSLLMRVKEESEKAGLKLNIKKNRSWHPPPSLHANRRGKGRSSDRYLPLEL